MTDREAQHAPTGSQSIDTQMTRLIGALDSLDEQTATKVEELTAEIKEHVAPRDGEPEIVTQMTAGDMGYTRAASGVVSIMVAGRDSAEGPIVLSVGRTPNGTVVVIEVNLETHAEMATLRLPPAVARGMAIALMTCVQSPEEADGFFTRSAAMLDRARGAADPSDRLN